MKHRQEIDLKLIEEAKKGSQAAYTKLYKHYHGIIQYNIFQLVYNTADAEDLTIVTFEKAFSKLDTYVPTNEFQTWLSKIARNTAIDFLVTKGRRPSSDVEIVDANIKHFAIVRTPEDELISKELGNRLDLALNKIKRNYKEVIKLRYYDDLEYDEISSKMNITEGVARSYILRAKRKLKNLMVEN